MQPIIAAIIGFILSIAAGGAVLALIYKRIRIQEANVIAQTAKLEARTEAFQAERALASEAVETRKREIVIEAKDEAHRIRKEAEGEIRDQRAEILRLERRVTQKEEVLERRLEAAQERENDLALKEAKIAERRQQLEHLHDEQERELSRIAQLSLEEARTIFLKLVEDESRHAASKLTQELLDEAHRDAERKAQEVVVEAIQRCSLDQVNNAVVSVVELPNDDMKGRIIGREGRNIRTFEQILGVDVIIDDTPEAVVISCFDPIRREIARIALLNLVVDGRIHPTKIEEAAQKASVEVERQIAEAAERAVLKTGIPGLHPEIVRHMGRLRYRTSYGQNVLDHSVEVAFLASTIASEIGINVEAAKRAAFLHDIGKGMDITIEGPHALIGMELIRKHGESPIICNAVGAHHNEIPTESLEALIVIIADGLSASRPGARRETLESYIKRLEKLEAIADEFVGVEKAYAIQAGREVRILVRPAELDDLGSQQLARDVARQIEKEMEYPGQIKVTVIRETRSQDYAK